MAGLQRSAVSFRRQGSSGLVWEDRLVSGELNQQVNQHEQEQDQVIKADAKPSSRTVGSINVTIDRSRSNGGARGFRTGKVSPAIEPPSPKVSACGFCSALRKPVKNHRPKVRHDKHCLNRKSNCQNVKL